MLEHILCQALYGTHWTYPSSCKDNVILQSINQSINQMAACICYYW